MLPRRFNSHGLAASHADMVTAAGVPSEAIFAPRDQFDSASFLVMAAETAPVLNMELGLAEILERLYGQAPQRPECGTEPCIPSVSILSQASV